MNNILNAILKSHQQDFGKVVLFNSAKEKIVSLDLSESNKGFTEEIYSSTTVFSKFIDQKLKEENATYLIGGYREDRAMYRRSSLFDKNLTALDDVNLEPRSLHLGTDIWGAVGTPVFAPLGGTVHSFAFNNNFGDYGATIILQHQLDTKVFYTLYGHLSLKDIGHLRRGQFLSRGEDFGHFGNHSENGNWPPHLHFQVMIEIDHYEGDYPGVCKKSESAKYLLNCPDPDLILQLNKFIV